MGRKKGGAVATDIQTSTGTVHVHSRFVPPHKLIPWAWIFRRNRLGAPHSDSHSAIVFLLVFVTLGFGVVHLSRGGDPNAAAGSAVPNCRAPHWISFGRAPAARHLPLLLIPPLVPFSSLARPHWGMASACRTRLFCTAAPAPQASAILPHALRRRLPTADGRHH